jgi:hypothetical protein
LQRSGDGKLGSPVGSYEQEKLALGRLNLRFPAGDGVALELLALGVGAFNIRKAQGAVPLKAPMQRRSVWRRNTTITASSACVSTDELVSYGFLSFRRKDRTIKP